MLGRFGRLVQVFLSGKQSTTFPVNFDNYLIAND
jgi:hypothetical protein